MFQISKKQHELVKSLKLSCKNIPASTLNCVLGDLNNFHVQPYKLFIKEEQKNLHEHWLQLVKKHLPASYANWTERLIQKHAMRNSLLLEMKDRSNVLVEDEDILSTGVQAQDKEDGGVNNQSSLEDDEDSIVRVPEIPSLHNSYHSGDDELHPLHIDLEEDILSKGDDASHNKAGLHS
ncbi:nuclear factor related to kappa-B-binding protein, partial [Trifolium medium]|nr:nuclear factor related to kappa-B-binding protein [Trifolium medium]